MSSSEGVRGRLDVEYPPASPALLCVIICMTIMAACAVMYFAMRCYFEERHSRNSTCRKCASLNPRRTEQRVDPLNPPPLPPTIHTDAATMTYAEYSPVSRYQCDHPPWMRSSATGESSRTKSRPIHGRNISRFTLPSPPEIIVSSVSNIESFSSTSAVKEMSSDCRVTTISSISSAGEEDLPDTQTSPFHPRYNTPVSEENENLSEASGKVETPQHEDVLPVPSGTRDQSPEGNSQTSLDHPTPVKSTYQQNSAKFRSHQRHQAIELHAGGRLVTRWTQTEGGSLTSLEWDPYESERLRCAEADCDGVHYDSPVPEMNINDTFRASSPYVICFENLEEQTEPLDLTLYHKRHS